MYGVVHADVGTDAEEIMMQTLACPDVDADADVDSNVDAAAHAHADADVDADDGVAAADLAVDVSWEITSPTL